MVRISVARGTKQMFPSRLDYLKRNEYPSQRLCKVLEGEFKTLDTRTDEDPWRGFPWLTPVIGSGCLEIVDAPYFDANSVAQGVLTELNLLLSSPAEIDARVGEDGAFDPLDLVDNNGKQLVEEVTQAFEFTISLVQSRTSRAGTGALNPRSGVAVSALASRVTLVTALLTRFYFKAKADLNTPVDRWALDRVTFRSRGDVATGLLARLGGFHAGRAADEIQREENLPEEVRNSIQRLLERIHTAAAVDGTRHALALSDLRLLTQVSWLLLTQSRGIYPGWGDLLFGLALRDNGNGDHARPRFADLLELQSHLPTLLVKPTEDSAKTAEGHVSRRRFFDSVAEVLAEQALVLQEWPGPTLPPPPASAFVTSLDLELEMALWRRLGVGEAFHVVLPFSVVPGPDNASVTPVWLRGTIRRDEREGLDALVALREPTDWVLLTSDYPTDLLRTGAHVVRLSGSPLTRPPKVPAVEGLDRTLSGMAAPALKHAVTLDEHFAMRQAEAELLMFASKSESYLPQLLRAGSSDRSVDRGDIPRFWMCLGVPLDDPAVRLRLITQMSTRLVIGAPSAAASTGTSTLGFTKVQPEVTPTVSGVVVNTRIDDDDAQVLFWAGFDVVRDDASKFTQDLNHYALHLNAKPGDESWTAVTASCPLKGPGA